MFVLASTQPNISWHIVVIVSPILHWLGFIDASLSWLPSWLVCAHSDSCCGNGVYPIHIAIAVASIDSACCRTPWISVDCCVSSEWDTGVVVDDSEINPVALFIVATCD